MYLCVIAPKCQLIAAFRTSGCYAKGRQFEFGLALRGSNFESVCPESPVQFRQNGRFFYFQTTEGHHT